MKDEEFIFYQDIKEKKSIGRGIFCKKNGSKSKQCTLPSDKLTRKEKLALNGEVISWNMKKFYSWEEFKSMPNDIQVEYVNSLINRYDVGLSVISKEVFGKSRQVLSTYFSRKDELKYVNTFRGRHSSDGADRLKKAMASEANDICEPEKVIEVPVVETEEPKVESQLSILHMTVDVNGFDDDIWNSIKTLFDGQKVSVKISVFAGN